jgi:hypothetical protein
VDEDSGVAGATVRSEIDEPAKKLKRWVRRKRGNHDGIDRELCFGAVLDLEGGNNAQRRNPG